MNKCENFVKNHMPVVRAFMVKEFYNNYGMSQVEIASMLGITQPAISQYLRGYRGSLSELPAEILDTIKEGVDDIHKAYLEDNLNSKFLQSVFCKICLMIGKDDRDVDCKPVCL